MGQRIFRFLGVFLAAAVLGLVGALPQQASAWGWRRLPGAGAGPSLLHTSLATPNAFGASHVWKGGAQKGKSLRCMPPALSAAENLKTADREADIIWSASTGTIARFKGLFGEKTPAPPHLVARNFLKTHYRFFALRSDLSDVAISGASESCAGHRIVFQQFWDGVPVEGGRINVHVLNDGRVQMVRNRISLDLTATSSGGPPGSAGCACSLAPHARGKIGCPAWPVPSAALRISMEKATDIASRRLGLSGDLRGPILAEEVVLPRTGIAALAWKVSIPASQPCGDWLVMVDGQDGSVLSVKDVRQFAVGRGRVFDPNPVVALQTTSLSDQNDLASAVPENAYAAVTLEDLDGTGYLRGPYVDTGLTAGRAYSAALDFSYDRSQRGFEEVMVYYHVQEFQKYLRDGLGLWLNTRQVFADAHAGGEDASWFSPFIRAIYFGDGGVDDGEDAHLVIHEYVHGVIFDIVGEPPFNPEAGAMSEGTSDYFAASFFAERGFMPETIAHWDGIAETPVGLRRVDTDKVYPADMEGEEHSDGEIWSSALWHLRETVGREVADKLVANSVYYLDGSSQFSDGLETLLLADEAMFGGLHASAISSAFAAKGVLPPSPMDFGETRSGMLSQGDLTMPDGTYYDSYTFVAAAGQRVRITQTSNDFDAYLVLVDPFFRFLAQGDDLSESSTNARIVLTIPYGGTYYILANALGRGETGRYSLTLSLASRFDGTPQSTALAYGRQVSGYLGSGDLMLGDGSYYDEYTLGGHVGQQIRVSMWSSIMDAYLVLYDEAGNFIADSGLGYDVFLVCTLPDDGEYSLDACQALPTQGDYTILLESSDAVLELGGITSARLENGDLRMSFDGSYFDPYQFEGTIGQRLSLKMYSREFDPYLIVYDPYYSYYRKLIEIDDASPSNSNIFVEEFEIEVPGTYFIIANAYGSQQGGRYGLSVCPVSITDTDWDGYPDRVELAESTDPLDSSSVPPDIDGDLIPDNMDPDNDNDGMSDLAEMVAGTNPHDAASVFRLLGMTLQPQGLTLRWSSVPGRWYRVHRSGDLTTWAIVQPDVLSQGDVTTWTETDPMPSKSLFYRVEVLSPAP